MAGSLFNSIIFGPVRSRRLGNSLGVNLLPTQVKFCTFNCIYCECGWTETSDLSDVEIYSADLIAAELEKQLIFFKENNLNIDSITFAGNGEPTIHPEFAGIIEKTIELKNKYSENSLVTVLSNSSALDDDHIINALKKVNNIMKLDAGTEETFRLINQPIVEISLQRIVDNLIKFNGRLVVQSMFVRGVKNNVVIDNTSDNEIEPWLGYLRKIKPEEVMIYSLDRRPPFAHLNQISMHELAEIARKVENIGFKAKIF